MRNLPLISLNEPISAALDKFETSKAWSLPVVEGDQFLGMLSKSTSSTTIVVNCKFNQYKNNLLNHLIFFHFTLTLHHQVFFKEESD